MHITLPTHVKFIIDTLEAAGHEAFIVGGCVRDVLRGVAPKDWDIATNATPVQAKALFERTIDTGIKHGTITVLLDKQHYEVTTYRVDGEYLDARRPETVAFVSNIKEDLSRRDFTINAIAYNPSKGFVDPFDGQGDIKKKIIRCVGEPVCRFTEDALRMLRAVRFAGTTGFEICADVLDAIAALAQNLQYVSPERIREELGKLITSGNPRAVGFLQTAGLLPYMLGGVAFGGDMGEIILWLESCPAHEPMRMALFLHWVNLDLEKVLRGLRFDNKSIKEIGLYVKMLRQPVPESPYGVKQVLRHVPRDMFERLLTLKAIVMPGLALEMDVVREIIKDVFANGECFTLGGLAVNGADLAAVGVPKGKVMGDMLEKLLDMVMENPVLNKRDMLLAQAKLIESNHDDK